MESDDAKLPTRDNPMHTNWQPAVRESNLGGPSESERIVETNLQVREEARALRQQALQQRAAANAAANGAPTVEVGARVGGGNAPKAQPTQKVARTSIADVVSVLGRQGALHRPGAAAVDVNLSAAKSAASPRRSQLMSSSPASKMVRIEEAVAGRKRAESGAGGRHVRVGYKINAFGHVDNERGTFYCDFKLFAWWSDRALIGAPTNFFELLAMHKARPGHTRGRAASKALSYHKKREASGDTGGGDGDGDGDGGSGGHEDGDGDGTAAWDDVKLFDPELEIQNNMHLTEYYSNSKLIDSKTGTVKWSTYYRGTLFGDFDLHNFPFDYQQLCITIQPRKLSIDKAELKTGSESHVIDYCQKVEWEVVGHKTENYATAPGNSTSGKVYSELRLIIMVKRFPMWYLWNVVFFMAAMVTMSWTVFAIKPSDLGSRMEIAFALVLSVMASKFTISDKMPKTSYQTIADIYITGSFGFLFLVTMLNALAAKVGEWYDDDVAEEVDRVCLVCIAVLWLSFNAVLGVRLKRHDREFRRWKNTRLPWETQPEPPTLTYINSEPTSVVRAQQVFNHQAAGFDGGMKRWWHVGGDNDGGGSDRSGRSASTDSKKRGKQKLLSRA